MRTHSRPHGPFSNYIFRCVRISISIRGYVRWSVMLTSESMKNGLLRILNDLDRAGRRKRREEEGGTGRKEGRGE